MSPQGSAGGAPNTHLTQHQARIQAAAAGRAISAAVSRLKV